MQIISSRKELQSLALAYRREGKCIGLVPTMGFLHAGRLSLIDTARERADVVIVSIFVNPTQFAPTEDLDTYPRDFERDCKLCEEHKVDVIFAPAPEEMYNADASTWVQETKLSQPLCGASRPTFFRGVTTVVAKLFLLAQPDFAVFGLKDAQQLFVIKRMVRDMDFPIEIIPGALVRDSDGLALSSRNRYLSADERTRALSIHKSLVEARKIIENKGLDAVSEAISGAKEVMTAAGGRVDYVSALDIDTMKEPTAETRQLLLAAACFFGTTRLIDNELIDL
jgi:pantoate--beta-alanine ligase